MYIILSLFVIAALAIYLLFLLNKELQDKYAWIREIEYIDYINLKKLKILGSTETFTVSSMNKSFDTTKLINNIEYIISDADTLIVPFKSIVLGYIDNFYSDKDIISSIANIKDLQISLFRESEKVDSPNFFIGKNIYNIFVNYKIYKSDQLDPIQISNIEDYKNFLTSLYSFKNDFTCKVNYSVYKQIGKDEKGEKVFDLFMITKIGPSYRNITYGQKYITEVTYID